MQNYPDQGILHTHIHMIHSITFHILYHYYVKEKKLFPTFFVLKEKNENNIIY